METYKTKEKLLAYLIQAWDGESLRIEQSKLTGNYLVEVKGGKK